jgi:tRNA modification GTPase
MTGGPGRGPLDLSETIVAQATAGGRGALAIVRLSGPSAHAIARDAMSRWPSIPRQSTLTYIRDANGVELDQSLVTRYDAPASFTGEDSVEIMTHGGQVVPTTVVAALIARGARLATPGEFTRRAVLNGKLDLLQAEATGDLISADSRAAQRVALRQLDGGLTRRVLALRDELVGLEALIAYDIDFPEEDDGPIAPARILDATLRSERSLANLLETARAGELVRRGAVVALAGAPNVGKSSLFNALLGESRAIVTDIPGTTRDAIEAVIDTPTVPIRLVDTAGLRDATDPVERLGVQVSESYAARSALILACADDLDSAHALSDALAGKTTAPRIAVHTKSDRGFPSPAELEALRNALTASSAIAVSAESGSGLQELLSAITRVVAADGDVFELDAPLLTQERHRFAITQALDEVGAFKAAWKDGHLPAPVAAVHLRAAIGGLEDLIGSVDVEDVLDEVFRRFCVGK